MQSLKADTIVASAGVCVAEVEKDTTLRMSDTVEKIKQLMSEQRTARTCT